MIDIIAEEPKKIPCDQVMYDTNHNNRRVIMHSYYAVLCRKGGSEITALRLDHYERRTDVRHFLDKAFPEWNVKAVSRLYDEDFTEGVYIG